jgi:hypothetical protein
MPRRRALKGSPVCLLGEASLSTATEGSPQVVDGFGAAQSPVST